MGVAYEGGVVAAVAVPLLAHICHVNRVRRVRVRVRRRRRSSAALFVLIWGRRRALRRSIFASIRIVFVWFDGLSHAGKCI